MTAVSTTTRAAVVCAAAVLMFSGCAGQQQSTPATARASTTASPEATPPSAEPAADLITVSAEGLSVLDVEGVELARFDFYDPSAEVVDALAAHLGEPSIDTSLGDGTSGPAEYEWEGLRLVDLAGSGDETATVTDYMVVAESSAVGDVRIETTEGASVGSRLDEVVIGEGESVTELEDPDTGAAVSIVRAGLSELPPVAGRDGLNVGVQITAHDGIVIALAAPVGNIGE